MTKYDYLTQLKHYLQPLPLKERNAAMQYYEKYFKDAGPENERYVIMNLGTPKQLADHILKKHRRTISGMVHETRNNVRSAKSRMNEKQKKNSVFLTIFGTPVLILVIIAFVVLMALFALVVAGALVFMAACGIMLTAMSVPYITSVTSVALVTLGISLILIAVPVLVFMPAMNFVFYVIKKATVGGFALFNKQIKGKAAAKK